MINAEGVESLDIYELQEACRMRGIKTTGVSKARMQSELKQWVELNLIHKVPASVLILSRAFAISDQAPAFSAEDLQATLSSLPDNLVYMAIL